MAEPKSQTVGEVKRGLRRQINASLKAMDPKSQADQSRQVCDLLLAREDVQSAKSIAAYLSLKGELDLTHLLTNLFEGGHTVFVPHVNDPKGGKMTFVQLFSPQDLQENFVPNQWNILEPTAECLSNPERKDVVRDGLVIDLMVSPGLGFDSECRRLGRGRGDYDRFFEAYAAARGRDLMQKCTDGELRRVAPFKTIAVGFDEQFIACVPMESHDVQLHSVVMPSHQHDNPLLA